MADTLAQTPVPTKVILSIHTTDSDAWTHSGQAGAEYSTRYKAGEACPEQHMVCDATYCEIDRWNEIIAKIKEVTNIQVTGAACRVERMVMYFSAYVFMQEFFGSLCDSVSSQSKAPFKTLEVSPKMPCIS